MDRFSDYYFRDSFEHSSSESQLIDSSYRYDTTNPSHRSSRSQTPLSHSQVDGRLCLPNTSVTLQTTSITTQNKSRKFNLIGAFVPSLIIVTVITISLAVIILETDFGLLSGVRNMPEMVSFRYQVYKPIKDYFRNKLSIFF
nr:unnamed protein product [Callosobruchus analis]